MAWRRDSDSTVRISINPRPDGGYTLSTAYLGSKLVEDVSGTRQTLLDTINRHLEAVMPGAPDDDIRFASLDEA
jgi:hypothetical protein